MGRFLLLLFFAVVATVRGSLSEVAKTSSLISSQTERRFDFVPKSYFRWPRQMSGDRINKKALLTLRGGAVTTDITIPLIKLVIPQAAFKILLQLCLTALNAFCWAIPLQNKHFSQNSNLLALANSFAGGVFLMLGFGHMIPHSMETLESVHADTSLAFTFTLVGYLLVFFIEKIAFDSHSILHSAGHDHGHGHRIEDELTHHIHSHQSQLRGGHAPEQETIEESEEPHLASKSNDVAADELLESIDKLFDSLDELVVEGTNLTHDSEAHIPDTAEPKLDMTTKSKDVSADELLESVDKLFDSIDELLDSSATKSSDADIAAVNSLASLAEGSYVYDAGHDHMHDHRSTSLSEHADSCDHCEHAITPAFPDNSYSSSSSLSSVAPTKGSLSAKSAVVLVIAMSLHSLFESMALGLAPDTASAIMMATSVGCHQPAESIALLVSLLKSPMTKSTILKLLGAYSLMGLVGVTTGILIRRLANPMVDALVVAMTAGTFLYLGATEVAAEEFEGVEGKEKWSRFGALLTGIWTIWGVTQLTGGCEHSHANHDHHAHH